MVQSELTGKTALVTGASSGLGSDFARVLAEHGCRLVLVARREDRLNELANELRTRFGVESRVIAIDLSDPESARTLFDRLVADGVSVDILINNAGYGTYGHFMDVSWERERNMLDLDILTVVHMTKLFGKAMVERGRGWILLVSSIGAYQPSPTYASYSAAKSFVLNFGEALHYELRGSGVRLHVLSPGVTRTEFFEVSGQSPTPYQRMAMMDSLPVARLGIARMRAGVPSGLPGFTNRLSVWFLRFTPRRWMPFIVNRLMTAKT